MGVNCKAVETVIHLGPSKNLESSVQESGRCGRDGQQSNAIIYYLGRMLTPVDKSLKEYVCLHADGIACRREYLLECGERSCPANVLPATTTEFDGRQTRIRDVTAKQKHELTQKLIVLRKELNIPLFEKIMGYSGKIHPAELYYSSTSSLPFKLTRF